MTDTEALVKERDALARDAARYRYLRQVDRAQAWTDLLQTLPIMGTEMIDAAIDAARGGGT